MPLLPRLRTLYGAEPPTDPDSITEEEIEELRRALYNAPPAPSVPDIALPDAGYGEPPVMSSRWYTPEELEPPPERVPEIEQPGYGELEYGEPEPYSPTIDVDSSEVPFRPRRRTDIAIGPEPPVYPGPTLPPEPPVWQPRVQRYGVPKETLMTPPPLEDIGAPTPLELGGRLLEEAGKPAAAAAGAVLAVVPGGALQPEAQAEIRKRVKARNPQTPAEALSALYESAAEYERERPETFAGEKFILEMLVDPLNLVGIGLEPRIARATVDLAKRGGRLGQEIVEGGAKAARAVGQEAVERAGARPAYADIEDVGKGVAKQPWEMTSEDIAKLTDAQAMRLQRGWKTWELPQELFARGKWGTATAQARRANHEIDVKNAVQRGEPVPPEVLKDYPDLVAKGTEDAAAQARQAEIARGQGELEAAAPEHPVEPPVEQMGISQALPENIPTPEPGAAAVAADPLTADFLRHEDILALLEDARVPVQGDGTVLLYHGTTAENAGRIKETGTLRVSPEYSDRESVFLSTSPEAVKEFGDAVVAVRVPVSDLIYDGGLRGRSADFRIPTSAGAYRPVAIEEVSKAVAGQAPLQEAEIRAAIEGGIPPSPTYEPRPGEIWARPKSTEDLIATYTPQGTQGNIPVLSGIKQGVERVTNPSALAYDIVSKAKIVHERILDVGEHGVNAGMNYLDRLQKPFTTDGAHRVTSIPGKPALTDVLDSPGRYTLTPEQRTWADTVANMVADASNLAAENGIELRKLGLEPGRHYIPRVVEAIRGLQKEVYSGAGGRIGAKATHQRPRIYDWMEDGLQQGIDYSDPVTAMQHYVRSIYKMVADKRFAEIITPLGETIAERMPPGAVKAAQAAKNDLNRAKQLRAVINRAYRGERLPDPTIASIGRSYPAEAAALKAAGPESPALQPIEAKAKLLIEQARSRYYQTVGERARIRERVALPGQRVSPLSGEMMNETYLQQPFAGGRIFTEDVVKQIQGFYGAQGSKWLQATQSASNIVRQFATTIDFATPMLQGLTILGRDPRAWAKATFRSYQAFLDPGAARRYFGRDDNFQAAKELVENGGVFSSSEYAEAGRELGPIAQKLGPVGKIGTKVSKHTIGRFQEGFTTFLDAGSIEQWKALKPAFERAGIPLSDLAEYINHSLGRISTRGIGVGTTQRQIESSFAMFSPRYTRSGFAMVADAMQGGMKGNLARNSLAGMAGTGLLVYVAAAGALGASPEEIIEGLQPIKNGRFNSRFLTVRIGTDHVGFGSFWYSFTRLIGGTVATGLTRPEDLLSGDTFDNPILGWMRSRSAPAGSAVWDALSGRTYLGEPLDSPLSWANAQAKRMMPMWAEGYLIQNPPSDPQSLPANVLGGRVFPMSMAERRNELSDQLSQQEYEGRKYDDLNKAERDDLTAKYPELQQAIEATREVNIKRARTEEDRDTNAYYAAYDTEKTRRESDLKPLYGAFQAGKITGKQFRETRSARMMEYAVSLDQAKRDFPQAKITREERDAYYRDKGLPIKEGKPEDLIAEGYYNIQPKKDANGLEDMAGFWKERDAYLQQYDGETQDYVVHQYPKERFEDPEMQKLEVQYQKAQETLKPYWEVGDIILLVHPQWRLTVEMVQALPPGPNKDQWEHSIDWGAYNRAVELERKKMRRNNQAIDYALYTWYGYKPIPGGGLAQTGVR